MKREKDRLQKVVVIGATPAGIAAANKLGELGVPVTLVDAEPDLNDNFSRDQWQLSSGVRFNFAHRPGLIRILRNPGIRLFMPAEVSSIKHSTQGFAVRVKPLQTFVDPEKCTLCGRCADVCPVSLPDGKKAARLESRRSLPGRARLEKGKTPPCQEQCPLGVNAQGYIALTKAGKYAEALDLIRRENVLAGICGRVCTHPCEAACRRGELDEPVAIRDIKRFITDSASDKDCKTASRLSPADKKEEKIAIIGSGPAGLAAAAELARHGCEVTVYEKEKLAGGLLRYGIGRYRLPPDILDRDIEYIKSLGVMFVFGHPVDLDLGLDGLLKKFGSIIVTTGTWLDRKLGVPGEDLEGVEGCLSFLNRIYRGDIKELQGNVAVIGDGNSAVDLARALTRLGAEVTVVSWFAQDRIPADAEEVSGALAEGVTIKDSLRVVEFIGKGKKLEKLRCAPTIPGPADDKGIEWPVTDPKGTQIELPFDMAFVAIGQAGPLKDAPAHGRLQVTKQGFLKADDLLRTNLKNVRAAGDVVCGPTSVVEAMASGRNAARAALQEIFKDKSPALKPQRPEGKDYSLVPDDAQKLARQKMAELAPDARRTTFLEVAKGLSFEQAEKEAERCLQYGICSQCLQCADACAQIGAVNHLEASREVMENAGVVIIADPAAAQRIAGEDVIRAYDSKSSGADTNSLVIRGYAAAAKAMMLLGGKSQRPKGHGVSFSPPDPGLSPEIRIGVFVCKCNESLGWLDRLTGHIKSLLSKDGIVHAEVINAACVADGSAAILRSIREKGITRAVLASCACCSLNFVCSSCTDQRSRLKAALFAGTGVSRSMVEMCNLRGEVLRQIRSRPERALARFVELIDSSVERARILKPLPAPARNYNFTTAVIGESEAAVQSAQILAHAGLEVFWFNAAADQSAADHPNIHSFRDVQVSGVRGMLGDFQVLFHQSGAEQFIQAGAVIMSRKAAEEIKYIHQKELPGRDIASSVQQKGVTGVPFMYPGSTSVSGLYIADPAGIKASERDKGAAAAVLAACNMPRGPRSSRGFTVVINENRCRGCGRCYNHCPYQAISYRKGSSGGWIAVVDDALCKGCGNCISVCPSNAADSPYRNHAFLEMALEEALL
jgi:NADPH-dependent glutamate synthase beta subunit-like oxidoreductase/NAD-dependent dihydropyrimidine dehydrogenase PreA subunit